MRKFVLGIFLYASFYEVAAQHELDAYLKDHHYSFALEGEQEERTATMLLQRLGAYKLLLQAEGGSHDLDIYQRLPLTWIKFLNRHFGMRRFFLEAGHSTDVLLNRWLGSGDSTLMTSSRSVFWKSLYDYNRDLEQDKKLDYFGIDFERPGSYLKAIRVLLPPGPAPEHLKEVIGLLENGELKNADCDYILGINSELKRSLNSFRPEYALYLGAGLADLEKIVYNRGSCKDVYKDRNYHMAGSFLDYDKEKNDSMYFGELGEAHTVLVNRNTASIINRSPGFENKVCVVNLYCYNCQAAEEGVSNWPLKKIEKDILGYFLPYCEGAFTIFDLSGENKLISKYQAFGQFLIVAKNQH